MANDETPQITVQDKRTDIPIFIHSYFDDLGLDPYTYRVYCRLSRRAGNGTCHESVENIARGCLMSPRKVHDCLRILESHAIVSKQARGNRTSIFTLTPRESWVFSAHSDRHKKENRVCTICKPAPCADSVCTVCRLECAPYADEGTPSEGTPFKEPSDSPSQPIGSRKRSPKSKTTNPPQARERNEHFDYFASQYLAINGFDYIHSKADFVRLNALIKTLTASGKRLDMQDWGRAVVNYLTSPISNHSVKDLVSRYNGFLVSAVDRFNKPVTAQQEGSEHGKRSFAGERDDRQMAAYRLARRITESEGEGEVDSGPAALRLGDGGPDAAAA